MRIIKFRGKRKRDGEWVYGNLIADTDERGIDVAFIAPTLPFVAEADDLWGATMYRVDPATVGQFTGLQDKHGREIYEGDILREPPKNGYEKENYVAYEVFWHDNDCASHHIGWQMNRCHFQGCICGTMYIPEFLPKATARMEVIGNVFDNPELLEEGGEQ